MEQITRHICNCGQWAMVQNTGTGAWLCIQCAAKAMLDDWQRGERVSVSFADIGIKDVIIGEHHGRGLDILVERQQALPIVPIVFWKN